MKDIEKDKKHVLVVGNGFDLAIGRKTSYWDFFQSEYCPKRYPAPLIAYLNQNLEDENVRWLDLETALQNYAIEANSGKPVRDYFTVNEKQLVEFILDEGSREKYAHKDFSCTYKDMVDKGKINRIDVSQPKLGFTLDELRKPAVERDRIALQKIEEGLAAYLNGMAYKQPETMNFADIIMITALEDMDSKVYSFNYTNISKVYTNDDYRAEDYDEKIHYVHGSLKSNHIIVGAKDGDYGKYDFVQKAFDPEFGSNSLVRDLLEADEVNIYGHSLGDCDSQYFMPFFLQQVQPTAQKKQITIYTYDEKSKESIKSNIQKLTGNKLSWLYSMNQFQILTQKEMVELYEHVKNIEKYK